jgi:MSHA biogenesis protein MshQ
LDEISWNGTPGEVNDSSVNGFDGKAKGSIGLPKAQSTTPAMTGDPGTCGYGTFGGANTVQYVALGAPNLGIDGASGLSVSAWVRWGIDPTTGNNWANIVSNGNSGSGQFWLQHSQLNDRFEFAVKTSSTRNYVQSRTKPVSGQWYHVAGVYDGAGLHIYLNGVLDDNSTAVLTGTVSPFISTYLFNIGIDNSFARSFQGDIDEVRVFNGVLSASQVANIAAEAHTCPVVLAPDHIEISDSSGGSGVTCAPTTLTLRACADSSCATLYSGGINGTLTASTTGTPNWGAGTADFTIPASGSVTKTLQLTSVNSNVSATLGVTSAATNAATCTFVGNPGNCVFTAYNSGFIFSVPNHVAGTPQTVTIRAVKKADNSNACVAGLGNVTRTLQMSCAYTNPSTGTLPMQVGGRYLNSSNSASAACSSASGVSLAFDGSGVTTTTMSYSDVGKMLLTVAYPGSVATGDDGLSINGTSAFIAAPKDFAFSDMTSGPIKAGNNFTVTVTARNSQSAPTPNFGKESAPESVTVTHAKYQPIGGAASAGVFSGALSAFNNGAATASNLNWSEVGTIDISATLASANYQGSGLTATGNTGATGAVGPFIPDHFITTVTDGCTGCGFTYSGQPFAVTVTAKNGLATPTTTVNYDGTDNTSPKFAKQVTLSAWDAATGSAPPGSLLPVANTVVPLSAFEQGVAARNTTASQPFFTFTATPTAPTSIKIRAVETSAIPAVSSSGFTEGSTEIRSGRMKLSNQYGSELLALPVNLVAQYWINASAAWVNSATDNATSFVVASPATASALSFSNFQRNLTTVSVSGSPLTINLANGTGRFTLAAPGAGHIGSVDMLIPALSGLSCETAPVLLGCYLPSSTARATFGIYKSPLIYRRENY